MKEIDDDYIDVGEPTSRIARECLDDDTTTENGGLVRRSLARRRADTSHEFDTSDGSGAASNIDERIDQNAIIENDGRSDTNTFFYPNEAAPTRRQQFKRLIEYQDGMYKDERKAETQQADMRRWVSTICSKLDMSSYHTGRVEHICSGLNMKHMAHYSTEKVIIAVISLVANEDDRFIRDERVFRNLMGEVGTTLEELRKVRALVKRKSKRL